MSPASIAGYLAAALYLASAVAWWRAARVDVPIPVSGWDGLINGGEVREAIRTVNRRNALAAMLAAGASVLAGAAVALTP